MPLVAGNGLPSSSSYQNNGGSGSGIFELVDAKFKHGFTDKKYTLAQILSSDNCTTLLPSKEKFRKYIKKQIQPENIRINIVQSLFYIAAGTLYIVPIITGLYSTIFSTYDTSITGETHHSLILHNYGVILGDYIVPLLVTAAIAGILPLVIIMLENKTANNKITDVLNSYDVERNDTIHEHKLIAGFFMLCQILHEIKMLKSYDYQNSIIEIKTKIISIFTKYHLTLTDITNNQHLGIEQLDITFIDKKIRELLLSDHFSKIMKLIICKINQYITAENRNNITAQDRKIINPQFKYDLSNSFFVKNRILDIISKIITEEIDVRESSLPQPINMTRDLDLLGVRAALYEYWGDIDQNELVIHYSIDFGELSGEIYTKYAELYPSEFFLPNPPSVKQLCVRQAPMLDYHPEPVYSSKCQLGR